MSHGHGKLSSKEKFIKWRNYQTCQEAIFLACLNEFCDIQIHKPAKKALVTMQFLPIESLIFSNEDSISFSKLIQTLVKQRMNYEVSIGVVPKTATRRSENYRFILSLNILCDLLSEFGYVLLSKAPSPRKHRKKKEPSDKDALGETIHFIIRNGKVLFNKERIETVGKKVNQYINSIFTTNNTSIIISKNDPCLNSFVHQFD
ncbi:hypothetical protein EHI8A_000080 [Entamoeba histolytica HM-1:IMSS-B]|uniref:Uncharacterized protein n=8 Tax=Entamoeba TaxID=5758 RepID=C4LSL6_ENTH1|nr:hypothetical protein ENU1_182760 [Entamoeba nuttalli P19]XP_657406.1 hypothetical protein EHI_151750 [Entamoeba histolytica HM-1:IMSS]EMD46631.1 TATA-binding associated phosphoprotein, putative [Entamoeba histolytica KU27]EMH75691.1 hypothetical protein EHI8A_000080 [Entamoeba histolytica HM-1:IMSS-B]EMS17276.1 TATA-binding protein-associated phosphoprotein, putative [Entamoeba histolytica HM-3:IMSS]ENY59910.1 TATA-binding protein-associated phosphoprotein, putative [Entamoeba histolytica H|eukprot:XP_008859766.1 hypothetical protein ENU1_182760 [Entamoeba nuttalli P19]